MALCFSRRYLIGSSAMVGIVLLAFACIPSAHSETAADFRLDREYADSVTPLLKKYCFECHSNENAEAELNLEAFTSLKEIRHNTKAWVKTAEMLKTGDMPPKDADQPTAEERQQIRDWLQRFLTEEAQAHAGDPGRVVLRRLNNAEYTYTLRDLTGVDSLTPAHEFPVDGAAGEGFTNTGASLVMSPSLVTKYLDAAKRVADHLVLLPDGIRFSPSTTSRDWTNETLAEIRGFYRQFSEASGGTTVNLQGIVNDTNQGGRLPVQAYLTATLTERDAIAAGSKSIDAVAKEHGLNAKYLGILWTALNGTEPSLLLDQLRARWKTAKPADAEALAAEVAAWQKSLWGFGTVGHIGKVNGAKTWMQPVTPLVARQELKLKLPEGRGEPVTVSLVVTDAGDGSDADFGIVENLRLVARGRPDINLRDISTLYRDLAAHRAKLFGGVAASLRAADELLSASQPIPVADLAAKHQVAPDVLSTWLGFLGIGSEGPVKIDGYFTNQLTKGGGHDFVNGWGSHETPSVIANSSDQAVRIPGDLNPHSVVVHPSPTLKTAIGWNSPITGQVNLQAKVRHAHAGCGNGVTWSLELRRGTTRQRLSGRALNIAEAGQSGPIEGLAIHTGDVVSLLVGSNGGNHACDLTAVELELIEVGGEGRSWLLSKDVSDDILAGNPHADKLGNPNVWSFYTELDRAGDSSAMVLPAGSLLAKWQTAKDASERNQLGESLQKYLLNGPGDVKEGPDAQLYRELASAGGPLLSQFAKAEAANSAEPAVASNDAPNADNWGIDPALFGKHPQGATIPATSLYIQAPKVLEFRLPGEIADGCELVCNVSLDGTLGVEGSIQASLAEGKVKQAAGLVAGDTNVAAKTGAWTNNSQLMGFTSPIIASENSQTHKRIEADFAEFRNLFPAALCYTTIVPVDEVVTLMLYYREDDQLCRLMLDDKQKAYLDRLWDQLHYISQDSLTEVDALEQLIQYATQDADPKVFEPLRVPYAERAARFRQRLVETEPVHVTAIIELAAKAYRRPLVPGEVAELQSLYKELRAEEVPHDEAVRLMLAKVLVSPAFLYRVEQPGPGTAASPIDNFELATRLSYFLWSSLPDAELLQVAERGELSNPETLKSQMRRMLSDPKARRLATEFACQWLLIYEFDQHDEKSEQTFPSFNALRPAMYEESVRFFTNLFASGGSVLDILNADYCFVNEELAKHYGVPGVTGAEWRRIDNARQFARGGILAQATTLSKQSGASRTSPILRGNWVSEVLLGEKLPRPPKDVPQLPDEDAANAQLTVRQMTEKHSSDARCAGCHKRIDAFGFSLEAYDAIGRYREKDSAGHALDTVATTMDGTKLEGIDGLKNYLLTTRKNDFVRQFCRKLLGYGLGRAVQLSDEPLLAQMQANLQANNYQVITAIEDVITSRQFLEIRGRDVAIEE